jgi:hypothetical protein
MSERHGGFIDAVGLVTNRDRPALPSVVITPV